MEYGMGSVRRAFECSTSQPAYAVFAALFSSAAPAAAVPGGLLIPRPGPLKRLECTRRAAGVPAAFPLAHVVTPGASETASCGVLRPGRASPVHHGKLFVPLVARCAPLIRWRCWQRQQLLCITRASPGRHLAAPDGIADRREPAWLSQI